MVCVPGGMSLKRAAEEEILTPQRNIRIRLTSPSPSVSSGSDTESIHSFQGYEPAYVKDTIDASSVYNIEFEIAEDDDDERKPNFHFTDVSDDSDDSEFAVVAELDRDIDALTYDSLDLALLGDTSEENSTSPTSNSDVDPELPRNDYLDFEKCLLCQTDQKDISYPYCSTCFTWKKNLFPSRPKRKQKTNKKELSQLSSDRDDHNSGENVCSSIESENLGRENNLSQGLSNDSGIGSSGTQPTNEMESEPCMEPSTSESSLSNSKKHSLCMCRVCFQKPENGLFVHLKKGHVYGCYTCAKKIWSHTGTCPICRGKIFKVIKLFL